MRKLLSFVVSVLCGWLFTSGAVSLVSALRSCGREPELRVVAVEGHYAWMSDGSLRTLEEPIDPIDDPMPPVHPTTPESLPSLEPE